MTTVDVVWIIAAFNLACGVFTSWLAFEKNYDGWVWFMWGTLFGLIALIAISGAPDSKRTE